MKSLLWRIIPIGVWIAVITALGLQLSVPAATIAGALGCVAGFWVGARLAASRLRLWVPWAAILPAQALVMGVAGAMRGTDLPSTMLGPGAAWTLSSIVLWFGSATLWVGLFQTSSRRLPPCVALEAAAVTLVGAGIFAHHREGFINRPFFLVDPLWTKGYDPLPVFLAIGGVVAAVLILLLASKSAAASRRSTILDVSLLMVLMLALYTVFPTHQIKNLRDLQTGGQNGKSEASPTPSTGGEGGGSPFPRAGRSGGHGTDSGSASGSELKDDDFSRKKSGAQNAQPVAVVVLHDDYTPPDGFYYFRQTVFSRYNGQRVVRDDGAFDTDVADEFPADKPIRLPYPTAPERLVRPLETTVALISSHTRPFGLVGPTCFTATDNPDPAHFQRAYRVDSTVLRVGVVDLLDRNVGSRAWNDETWKHYLEAPEDPRYKTLTEECVTLLRPELRAKPLARAVAVKLWLDRNGTYDLTSKYEHSADPVGDFLFGDRVGYCVSFAHAAVALYRTVGVPARVGTGYAVDARFRGQGSSLLIRSNASHAWPEIFLEDVGWVPLDISPEKSLVKPSEAPDSGQQDLYGDLARKKSAQRKPDQAPASRANMQQLMRDLLVSGARILLTLLGLLLALCYGMKIWRRLEPRFASDADLPKVAYRSALAVLADHGRLREHGQTREAFARQLSDTCPSLRPLTNLHLRDALGRPEGPPSRADLISLYTSCRTEIDAHTPWSRRLASWLHPLGWWLVK